MVHYAGFRIRQLDQVFITLKYNLTYFHHYKEQLDYNMIKLFRAIKLSYPKACTMCLVSRPIGSIVIYLGV